MTHSIHSDEALPAELEPPSSAVTSRIASLRGTLSATRSRSFPSLAVRARPSRMSARGVQTIGFNRWLKIERINLPGVGLMSRNTPPGSSSPRPVSVVIVAAVS